MTPDLPHLPTDLVRELTALAERLDGGSEADDQEEVDRFNALAGTALAFEHFQGIQAAEEHQTFVERVLTAALTRPDPHLDRARLAAHVQAVLDDPADDRRIAHVDALVRLTLGEEAFTDAIFWPDAFFGHGDPTREHTAEEIADALLARREARRA